ncbi:hypothetical protein PHMEG_00019798 [Phytophthora megakarya]|uniref:Chromo domain-containing protein n=1 Tax=Phytophthora megakarya TaxID=4795 RepID=A0A225VRL1_9STRA|nr:hypothetical protein PHMEG_00019798 [Phytophthora megakarya]
MAAVTRSRARGDPLHKDEVHRLLNLKKLLRGEVDSFSRAQIRRLSKEADMFVLDSRDVLFRLNHSDQGRPRHQTYMLRLAVQETLRQDILHYVHEDFHGRLKPRALFPKRPTTRMEINDDEGLDAALLPDDSWEVDNTNNEYEVEEILDLRWSKWTRTSNRIREYLIKWRGYDEPDWVALAQLGCGALLYEFNQGANVRARFQAMQAGDDHPRL